MKYLIESFSDFINENNIEKQLKKAQKQLQYAKDGFKSAKKSKDPDDHSDSNMKYHQNQIKQWEIKVLKLQAELGQSYAIKKLEDMGIKLPTADEKQAEKIKQLKAEISFYEAKLKDMPPYGSEKPQHWSKELYKEKMAKREKVQKKIMKAKDKLKKLS